MKDLAQHIKNLIPPERDATYSYQMGYDCAINGANTTNCNFAIFTSQENTRAWERGKRDGTKALEVK